MTPDPNPFLMLVLMLALGVLHHATYTVFGIWPHPWMMLADLILNF